MKILFVEPRYHTNQIGWIKCLQENNHTINMHVVSQGKIEDHANVKPEFIEPCLLSRIIIYFLGHGGTNNFRSFPNPKRYYNKIKNEDPDLVIVRDINRYISIVTIFISRILNKKILIYSQTKIHKKYSLFRLNITNMLMYFFHSAWISPIIGDSSKFKKIPQHMYYVPFAVKTIKNNVKKSSKIKILTIGKFEDRKNHLMLLKSLLSIQKNYELLIIGEVSNQSHKNKLIEIQKFIKENNLLDKVKIKTNIPFKEIEKYYIGSDLFVLPATREHASISVLESLGFGVPSICSDTNGTKDYIKDNENGLIFSDNSKESLTRCLEKCMSNNTLSEFKHNLKNTSAPEYSYENFYENFCKVIKKRYL